MIVLEAINSYRSYRMPKSDYDLLVTYLSTVSSFPNSTGKYYLHKEITYPRYKVRAAFEKFNQKNRLAQRSIAKNESYADYIIVPTIELLDILENFTKNRDTVQNGIEYKNFSWISKSTLSQLQGLINLYNFYKDKPIIDFKEFSKHIDSLKDKLTIEGADTLMSLLAGDDSSTKLGMEMLTNYDFENSLIPILLVISRNTYNMKNSDYWHSTAFRSFRDKFYSYLDKQIEYVRAADPSDIYDLIKFRSPKITESEYIYLRKAVYDDLIKNALADSIELDLTESQIKLTKIPVENIIPDEEYITDLDQITEDIILTSEDNTTYSLIDDSE